MRGWKTYAALQGSAVDVISVQLANGHGRVLVRIHLDEGKTTVGLETSLHDIAKVLEEGNQVVLGGVRGQVAHIARGLPLRGLLDHHVVALDAMRREVVVTKRRGRGHAHGGHGLLLGNGRLSLLVGPVAPNSAGTQPFTIHRAQGLLGLVAVAERNKPVATRTAGLHVPHHAGLGHRAERIERLLQDLVVDLIAQVSDEDVEVVRGVFFVRAVGLVGPVDADFLVTDRQRLLQGACGELMIHTD